MPSMLASKMTFIITWAEDMGFLKACSGFLKFYNKGTYPSEEVQELLDRHDKFIQENTYFGMLLEPVYVLRKHAMNYIQNERTEVKKKIVVNDPFASLGL